MATAKELGVSNVASRDITPASSVEEELIALLLDRAGGVVKMRQGDVRRYHGFKVVMTVDPDGDLDDDDTEVTVELVL